MPRFRGKVRNLWTASYPSEWTRLLPVSVLFSSYASHYFVFFLFFVEIHRWVQCILVISTTFSLTTAKVLGGRRRWSWVPLHSMKPCWLGLSEVTSWEASSECQSVLGFTWRSEQTQGTGRDSCLSPLVELFYFHPLANSLGPLQPKKPKEYGRSRSLHFLSFAFHNF